MAYKDHLYYLQRCVEVSQMARDTGNMPFGCILVDQDGEILMEQMNIEGTEYKCTGHAETQLIEKASMKYSKEFLWTCTLYSTAEPCAMCTGAMYWANLGRIVYGMTEKGLLEITGSDPKNPTFDLPCREVLARGQKDIEVLGPFPEIVEAVAAVHKDFWNK
ncbi:MAG: nucleoside deaminase [Cellulosilyticaceae bacterium]